MPGSNSSGSTTSSAGRNARRKRRPTESPESVQPQFELNKDGELVQAGLSTVADEEEKNDGTQEEVLGDETKSRNKRKQTFERRNIK